MVSTMTGPSSRASSVPGAAPDHPQGLRERKKDATRRALAETALGLAVAHGYDSVTIAEITERVGVSRRTFSNYFAGKAECLAAVTEGWLDDIIDAIHTAPADRPLESVLCDSLQLVAVDLPERWERFVMLVHAEPELQAMIGAIDAANTEQLSAAIGDRLGLPPDEIRVRMLSTFGIVAGRMCLEDWILRGRPGGERSFDAQLNLAFSLIDLAGLDGRHPIAGC